jgi:predicted ABC-type ATPase
VLEGYTDPVLDHRHKIMKATATELEWDHAHRLILIDNDTFKSDVAKGGAGSGNFGHAGRPGERGGSAPGEGGGGEEEESAGGAVFHGKPIDPDGADTMYMYRRDDGSWTDERAALHREISRDMLKGKTPVDAPVAYMMGGGTASGKSSLIGSGILGIPDNSVMVDSDAIKGHLPEYQRMKAAGDYNAAAFAHEESSYLAKKVAHTASVGGFNVVFDGTGDSSYGSVERKVTMLRAGGQRVVANYASVPVETAIARNLARAEKTGRYVPESFIRQAYGSINHIMAKAAKNGLFDELTVWDTTSRTPSKIIEAKGKNITVYDEEKWKAISRGA